MLTLLTAPKDKLCAKAKSFLEKQSIAYTERDIIEDHPSADELIKWAELGGVSAFALLRSGGFLLGGFAVAERLAMMNETTRFSYLAATGKIIRRPLLVGESFFLVGFDESVWIKKLSLMKKEQ